MEENQVELYRKHRPKLFKQVLGQSKVIGMLEELLRAKKLPHVILLSGPSGCGKTTIARILKTKLNCGDADFNEINAADTRGIDTIRDIRQRMFLTPIEGDCRIWLFEEAHQFLAPSQNILLKMLEDTPSQVYFMLTTTEPNKLLETVRTRCTQLNLSLLSSTALHQLIHDIVAKEQLTITEQVIEQIINCANGSARKAIVFLHQITGLKTEDEQLEAIQASDTQKQAIEIARGLLDSRTQWADIAKILDDMNDEPESIRHMVLSYCTKIILKDGKQANRAYLISTIFNDNFYDSKRAGLIRACYEVFSNKP